MRAGQSVSSSSCHPRTPFVATEDVRRAPFGESETLQFDERVLDRPSPKREVGFLREFVADRADGQGSAGRDEHAMHALYRRRELALVVASLGVGRFDL